MDNVREIYIEDGNKNITFVINRIEYTARTSIGTLLIPNTDADQRIDVRSFVSLQLLSAVISDNKPNINDIIKQDDMFFTDIFDQYLKGCSDFYSILNNVSCEETCERYAVAYAKYCLKNIPNATENIQKNISNTVKLIGEAMNPIIQNQHLSFTDSLTEAINKMMSSYRLNFDVITKNLQSALKGFSTIVQSVSRNIISALKDIQVPEFSEEQKEELVKSYEQWGKHGWTLPPYANINCFNVCPDSLVEADKIALKYCTSAQMEKLFSELESICVRKKDLREAIFCYKARQYKACALIIFSIIDSRVIRRQSKKDGEYKVGIGAISKYKRFVKNEINENKDLFVLLSFANLFSCLFAVFGGTNDFSNPTSVINRNYLDHGMSYKTVRKKDCIKLFILLYNLLEFIDIMK